jgi:hypothetical protein
MFARRGRRACALLAMGIGLWLSSAARAEPARERRLHVAAAEASSYLVNDWNRFQENYLPLYVGDDDPRTAWNLKTEGIGEWIRVHVTPMQNATHVRFRIRNGFQKSQKLFAANSRARQLTVVLLPSKQTVDVDLTDTFGWQDVAVDQPAGGLDAIELHVKAVYPGKKYDDLCLSDVQLYVTATTPDNPAYEKQHFAKIVTWKQERAAAAALFKSEVGKTLPIAAQYSVSVRPAVGHAKEMLKLSKECRGSDACWIEANLKAAAEADLQASHHGALEMARALAGKQFAAMTPVRVSAQDRRPIPRVDGICTPTLDSCEADPCWESVPLPLSNQTGFLRSDDLALVEQTGLPSFAEAAAFKPAQCHTRDGATFAWAVRDTVVDGTIGPLRALLLFRCGLVEGREGSYTAGRPQLLVYGQGRQLELTAGTEDVALLEWTLGPDGPKLASALLESRGETVVAQAAPSVAAK